jgi:hypothetical protein
VGEFGGDVGADGGLEGDDVVEDAQGVFAHFFAGEEFRWRFGEVQTELNFFGGDRDADVVIAHEQAAVAAGDGAAGVEKPGLGASGIDVKQLEEFLLKVPEAQEAVFSDTKNAEVDDRFEKGKVGVRVGDAFESEELEAALQAGDDNRGAVQPFGDIGEGVWGGAEGVRGLY